MGSDTPRRRLRRCVAAICALSASAMAGSALADAAPFDLSGPALEVKVSRQGATLPIWEVPALSAGDTVEVRPDFPNGDAAHYLLVLGFLRGATDPPPKDWFHKAETWGKRASEGIKAVVPAGAGQAVVFLAPATGGDFRTLVNAVRGRPGAFVHAVQAMHQASLDRSRLDAFLAAVRRAPPGDPDRLKTISPLLARSLEIKINEDCLNKTPALQAACLTGKEESLVLDDGHSPSMVQTLTTGSSADLALSVTATPKAGLGYYSPYVAAVMDLAHVLDGLRTAQYQYIPALPSGRDDELDLLLNTAPSFHNPKSVLVTSLPLVEPARPPRLAALDPKADYCASRSDLVLPVEGAPLLFSTGYARNLGLRVKDAQGESFDLPVRPDPEKGGLVIDTAGLGAAPSQDGVLVGDWGFESFEGPTFHLQSAASGRWTASTAGPLVAGREDKAVLQGGAPACIEAMTLQREGASPVTVAWKPTAGGVEATLPLTDAKAGPVMLLVKSYGENTPQAVALTAYAEAGHLGGFVLHAGDSTGVLEGARLDQVAELRVAHVAFKPGELTSRGGVDQLVLQADDPATIAKLAAGQPATAEVRLRDGRKLNLAFKVAPRRPSIALISKSVQLPNARPAIHVDLTDADELPHDASLTFSVRAQGPTRFGPHSSIEVATLDGAVSTTLEPGAGLVVEDPGVAIASLDPARAFGPSGFGGLKFRLVDAQGASDWVPLGTLVRTPQLSGLECPAKDAVQCTLAGSGLFLIDQVSTSPSFDHAVAVPEGFPGQSITVPAPTGGRLYVKLHDDPAVINDVILPQGLPANSQADAGAQGPG